LKKRKTVNLLLSFVNEETKNKFILTDDLNEVCEAIGWYKGDIESCGGLEQFVKKNQKKDVLII